VRFLPLLFSTSNKFTPAVSVFKRGMSCVAWEMLNIHERVVIIRAVEFLSTGRNVLSLLPGSHRMWGSATMILHRYRPCHLSWPLKEREPGGRFV
jgi:hypothetical protein